ncbi:hypothetical protein ACLB1R_18660 [Escherichia coli]
MEQWLWSLGQRDMTFSLMMGVPGRLSDGQLINSQAERVTGNVVVL